MYVDRRRDRKRLGAKEASDVTTVLLDNLA
jgi:hypothetical protein